MIRLEYLKLRDHPQLGDIELFLSDPSERKNKIKPYTSVIIGPNGTGKSYILRTIAEILRQFKSFIESERKEFSLPFDLHLRYQFHHNTYEIVTKQLAMADNKGLKRDYLYFKNRPLSQNFISKVFPFDKITGFEVLPRELEFPEKLLVNSLMLTDRFIFQESKRDDFYQYLGVRSTSGSTSTRASSKRTIRHLFNATGYKLEFYKSLKELLSFLEFEPAFQISYSTKINKLFFSGELKVAQFEQYFENWWAEDFIYSNRKKENPLWSIPFYNNNFKNKPTSIEALVDYLNELASSNRLTHKKNSSAKLLSIDLLDTSLSVKEMQLISELENLDIINLDGIKLKKRQSTLSISDLSSGEYHLIISLIGIFSNISEDSVILIDEPEISLHPNWQMRYITFLKSVFAKFPSCHFIITTHSHFLVSDLEGDSSSVTALLRDSTTNNLTAELLKGTSTFGWSAEEVLYKIFKTPTSRNYYLAEELNEIFELISQEPNEDRINKIKNKVTVLKSMNLNGLSEEDPLKDVIKVIFKEFQ
jgi:predicted ATPase